MKRLTSFSLAVIMLFAGFFCFEGNVFAYSSWECGDNLTAVFSDNKLTISGFGDMYNYSASNQPGWKNSSIEVKSLEIENGVNSIGDYAFANLFSLSEVKIADSVTKIGNRSFAACIALKKIDVPANVNYIGDSSFQTSSSTLGSKLQSINVDSDNKYYCDVDGVLYNKAKTVLIQVPSASPVTSLKIADTAQTVMSFCAVRCNNLKEITIPASIKTIGANAFERCKNLEKVNINTNKTFIIGVDAFKDDNITIYSFSDENCFAKRYAQQNNITFVRFPVITVAVKIDGVVQSQTSAETPFGTQINDIPIKLPEPTKFDERVHIVYRWSPEPEIVTADASYTAEGVYENHNFKYKINSEPTCSQEGIKTPYCDICNAVFAQEVIPKNNHSYELEDVVIKASEKSDGKIMTVQKCTLCRAEQPVGTISVIPRVTAISLQKTTIGYNWYYTGKQITPTVTVKDRLGNTLKRGTDYSLTYDSGRVKTGKYNIKVTFKGDYEGTKTLTFEIVNKANNRWLKSGNRWWYRHADGSYTKNDWEKIDGKWYHFDKDGWMQTGWLKDAGKWYYLDSSGAMQTGWEKIGGKWYYMNSSGVMLTGRQKIGNKWYTFNSSGVWIK